MPAALFPPGPVAEQFPIMLADGTELYGSVHKTSARRSGRRIQVRDNAGKVLFDSDDCFDLSNATNKLDHWLADTYPA